MSAHTISFWCRAYVVIQVTNHAPSRPNMNPINGLEIANQNGAASRKRQESCCVPLMIFSWYLIRRSIDPCSARRVRATQQGAIRKSRTSGNHRWTSPIPDVRRATRRVSAAEVACKNGSPQSLSEECLFSSPATSSAPVALPFRVRRILQSHFGVDSRSLFRGSELNPKQRSPTVAKAQRRQID